MYKRVQKNFRASGMHAVRMTKKITTATFYSIICIFLIYIFPVESGWTRVFFRLQGRDLSDKDNGSSDYSDPFVKVYEYNNGEWECLGRSETLENTHNPNWKKLFMIEHNIGSSHRIKIEVRDHDGGAADDAIGDGYFNIGDTIPGGKVSLSNNGGNVIITPEFLNDDGTTGSCFDRIN